MFYFQFKMEGLQDYLQKNKEFERERCLEMYEKNSISAEDAERNHILKAEVF